MALIALLVLTLFGAARGGAGPDNLPGDLMVVPSWMVYASKMSVFATGKDITVFYFPTDQCKISEGNMKILSGLADDNPDVKFIAVLRFLSSGAKEFLCDSKDTNTNCIADSGASMTEVKGYLPAGTKVKVVQDLYKGDLPAKNSNDDGSGCFDEVKTCPANIEQYKGAGMDKAAACAALGANCKKTCGTCTRRLAAKVAPECTEGTCGGVWNQYGSDGSIQSAWNIKEQLIVYRVGGMFQGGIYSEEQKYPAKDKKAWDKDSITTKLKGIIDSAKASKGAEGAAAAASPSGAATTAPAPSPGGNTTGTGGNGTGTPASSPVAAKATADGAVQATWRTAACLAALAPALVL